MAEFQDLSILRAQVGHKRFFPKVNSFSYKVFYIRRRILTKPLKNIPTLFSTDRWNILSQSTKMHGAKDGQDWHSWIKNELQKHELELAEDHSIYLISHPRLFGFAFNPISYWMIHGTDGTLRAVLCEVRNTFKQYHNYLLYHPDKRGILPTDIFYAEKELYVSPFNTVEGYYEFTFKHTEKEFSSVINYHTKDGLVLNTHMGGKFYPMNNIEICKTILLYPLMTFLVVYRIHLQAVKLWFKKVKNTLHLRSKNFVSGKTTSGKDSSPN